MTYIILLYIIRKYNKLYDQHIRNQNKNLIPILLDTEDQINALQSKVGDAIDVYKEVKTLKTIKFQRTYKIIYYKV